MRLVFVAAVVAPALAAPAGAASGIHPLAPTGAVAHGEAPKFALRITCSGGACRQEGPATRFTVS
jgi:hypothetical protein